MHFNWCTLHVRNLEESIKFYEEIAGLPLNNRFFAGPDQEIAFLGSGETKLELISRKDDTAVDLGKDISIGFEAVSLDNFMELLKEKNIPVAAGPIQPGPHIRFIYVKDPDGLTVQFSEHPTVG